MKRLAILAAGVLALAGCGTQNRTAEATGTSPTPGAPAMRVGAADELGWSLYNHDRVLAGDGSSVGPVYASHD